MHKMLLVSVEPKPGKGTTFTYAFTALRAWPRIDCQDGIDLEPACVSNKGSIEDTNHTPSQQEENSTGERDTPPPRNKHVD